jgi:excisionase family DNA binding protein
MGRYGSMRDVVSTYGDTEKILDAQEAAALLRVSVKTLLKLARNGALVGRKVGREWRFCHADVVAFVRHGAAKR